MTATCALGAGTTRFFDEGEPLHRTLSGRQVVIVGTGEIGSNVAARAAALGARMAGVNRSGSAPDRAFQRVVKVDAVDGLLPEADVLVLSMPLTDATRGFLDEHRIALLGPHALLVNLARGPVVKEQALYDALKSRRIAGAALDVWYSYPERTGSRASPRGCPFGSSTTSCSRRTRRG